MANVNIKFNNKDYLLSCDDGQEESLKRLTEFLDKKYKELKDKLGNIGENKLLLITAVKVMDEYYETKKKVEQKKDELKDLTNLAFKSDVFGAPTFIVNKKIFWGQDRLEYAIDEYNS